MTGRIVGALAILLWPALVLAQQTPSVSWKTPATWNIDVFGGRTFSVVTDVKGDAVHDIKRQPGWVSGATFGRHDGHRVGFSLQLLVGQQRTTEFLFDPPRPVDYSMHFVEVPLLARFDPFARKDSGGLVSVFGGVGIGRRFNLERTFDARSTSSRWAMYTDAIAGASVDLRRVIVNVEYLSGLTKFAPASGAGAEKHLRSFVVSAGYQVKRGQMHGPEGAWEVELHVGGLLAAGASDGTGTLPPAGTPYVTRAPGVSSRRVSTWLIGDGPVLFSQATSFLSVPPPALVPLDRVLTTAAARRKSGEMYGVRLSHAISSRISAEMTIDIGRSPVSITKPSLADIKTSRASFVSAFTGLLPAIATSSTVTATSDIQNDRGRQILGSAGVLVRLTHERKLTPYVRGGAGFVAGQNGTRATLEGVYDFRAVVNAQYHESDLVTIKFSSGSGWLGLVGGGATLALNDRTGFRFDAGLAASSNTLRTTITTGPSRTSNTAPFAFLTLGNTTPGLEFVNFNSTQDFSSLSGAPLQDFETFRGRGLQMQTAITVGMYRRF